MSASTDPPKCRLLDLAAELRNRIYEYALCSENNEYGEVEIRSDTLAQPALLSTCKQIRREAAPIYYLENEFGIDAPGFNPSLIIASTRPARLFLGGRRIMGVVYWGTQHAKWSDLLRWLKCYHDDEAEPCELSDGKPFDCEEIFHVVTKAFDVIDGLKGVVPWAKIEEMLELWKDSTESTMKWAAEEKESEDEAASEAEDDEEAES